MQMGSGTGLEHSQKIQKQGNTNELNHIEKCKCSCIRQHEFPLENCVPVGNCRNEKKDWPIGDRLHRA